VNFRPLVEALRGTGIAVYAVELPGHQVAAEREPFAPNVRVAEHVDDVELTDHGHYFLPIRPGEAAAEVLRAAGILVSR
jgi:hypothetical protein